ncbi:MAG TPA: hypothetical protein VLS90_00695, partial [Thermodesulfobacteriota bacterium]|nr:hypothetical protein [Thermodesulfobacteriota bacterium]
LMTISSARKLMKLGVNILGYGEIQVDMYGSSKLMDTFYREMNLNRNYSGQGGFTVYVGGEDHVPFLGAVLQDKSHVYHALREFLRKERPFS